MSTASTALPLPARPALSRRQLAELTERFEVATADEVICWAVAIYGRDLALTTSFADTVLVDIATRVDPDIEVVFLDTGFHFAETLSTMRLAQERYGLDLHVVRPHPDADDLWAAGTNSCCEARKVEPLERALIGRKRAWLSGLRRADSPQRASTPIVELDRRGLVKINPLANWSDADVAGYRATHDVIVNPLEAKGYPSIGCWPCSEPVIHGTESRAGRWVDSDKTECGLHL